MTQEVVTRLRDDLDRKLGDDVATRQFCWGKSDFEFELNDKNYESFQQDYESACDIMTKWVKIARNIDGKSKRRRESKTVGAQENIKSYAARYGLDWRDDFVRNTVREWAINEGYTITGKRIPRPVLNAYIMAHKLVGT